MKLTKSDNFLLLATVTLVAFISVPCGLGAAPVERSGEARVADETAVEGWLGVVTTSLPKVVAVHMDVVQGTGLVVEVAEPGGPAALAGLRENDVILRFENQILINPEQLAVLEGMRESGDEVRLEILRQEEPLELGVELGRRPVDYVIPGSQQTEGAAVGELALAENASGRRQNLQGELDRLQRELHAELRRLENPDGELRRDRMDMRVQGRVQGPAHAGRMRTSIHDAEGTVTITRDRNGDATIEARDPDGELVYEGPYTTEEDKEKVPEDIRRRAARAE